MALTPYLLRDFWDDPMEGPSPFLPEDAYYPMKLMRPNYPIGLLPQQKQMQEAGLSEVVNNDREFRVNMDVHQFRPQEINIKTKDNRLIVNAHHEERPDEHGFIMREFTRQYVLPKDVDPAGLTSSLNRDGVLTLKAPKMALEAPNERSIPIMREERKPITYGHVKGHRK
ncbi:alpha-crystallin B chain-like [Littorina saxatilis]|uniref:SHSP domain-containing protein n=1 Tax=Littorina saxatilis TaxID=31220 RepID=A0AAN9BP95_9CAEN